ncbi:MAG: PD-(D/E)XK nuclease family protein [Gemmatimonadaceae bacterium]
MSLPTPPNRPERALLVHDDPSAVADWCAGFARAGAIYVASSAAVRRRLLRAMTAAGRVTVGLRAVSRGRLVELLESAAGLAPPRMLPPALARLLLADAGHRAAVPLFDEASHIPAGAIDTLGRLVAGLRINAVTPAAYAQAGGDARAARAYELFEQERARLGFADAADRVARLIARGVPALPFVFEELSLPNAVAASLFAHVVERASSLHVGACTFEGSDPAWLGTPLDPAAFAIERRSAPRAIPALSALGGVGMHDEAELVAREMLALLRRPARPRDAVRPGDILGVAPTATYLALLQDACARLGMPIASPRRVPVLDVPIVRALLDSFTLLADERQDTNARGLAILRTPYTGLSLHRQDRLTRQLTRAGLGAMRSWSRFAEAEISPRLSTLGRDVPALARSLAGARAPRELAAVLSRLALDYGFLSAGRRAHLAAGLDEAVRRDQQGWNALVAAMEAVGDAMRLAGITRVTAARWLTELREALAGATVPVEPKGTDGVHLTRAGAGLAPARHVFALGWREGIMPRRLREDPLLPERVKHALNARGAMFPLIADRAGVDAELRERIVRAARESLVISWPAVGEEGEAVLPSRYIEELGVPADARRLRSVGDPTWPMAIAATRGERLARATTLAHHRPAASLGTEEEPVRTLVASLAADEARTFGGARNAGRTIELPVEVREQLANEARNMSASQAQLAARCLYQHFGSRRLRLEYLESPDVDATGFGTIAHVVLARLGPSRFAPGQLLPTFETAWRGQVSDALAEEPVIAFNREILLVNLEALVEREGAFLATTAARPAHCELSFGQSPRQDDMPDPASRAEPVQLKLNDAPIPFTALRGSIDRVDIVERDGVRYGVAIDYKSGNGKRYFDEMEAQADFQLPIYALVLREFGIEPVGAFYLGIADGARHGVVRDDFAADFVPDDDKVKVLAADAFDAYMAERIEALRAEVTRIARGELVVGARNDDCGYCELRPVCRVGTFGVGGVRADD